MEILEAETLITLFNNVIVDIAWLINDDQRRPGGSVFHV